MPFRTVGTMIVRVSQRHTITGQAVVPLCDRDIVYGHGFFEEPKLVQVHAGRNATVRLMGQDRVLEGHVGGVWAAISDSERTTATGTLLADVKPTFSWVRLAQRVPVRIAIDRVPKGLMLVAGRTATVRLDGADGERQSTSLNSSH